MTADLAKLNGPYACVVDVGAGHGSFAASCLEAWPNCTVHSFEPARGMANNDRASWHWHRVALNDRDSRLDDYADLIKGRALLAVAPQTCLLQILLGAGEALRSFAALLLPAEAGSLLAELVSDYVTSAGFGRAARVDGRELWVRA